MERIISLISKINSSKIFRIFLAIIALGYLSTLWNRYIYIDDAWFGEQAFWMAKDGIPRVETLKGYFGWDTHLLVYHRFNIIFGAGIIKIFGWSVEYFRIATLLVLIAFFTLLYKYSQIHREKYGNHIFILWLAFIFANPLMISLSFTYRPEIWVMLFGFLSWWFVEKCTEQSFKPLVPVLGGAFAGMAFFTHLNGLIFPVAGFVILLINKKIKPLVLFSMAAFITSSLFFYDLWQEGRLETFLYQMRNWPDPVGASYLSNGWIGWLKNALIKLSMEHQRFFWSYKVWMVSVMFLTSIVIFFKTILKQHRNLLIYTLVLIFSLNILGSQIAERFLIYLMPYMAILAGISFRLTLERGKVMLANLFKILAVFQFVFCLIMIITILQKNLDYVDVHTGILAKIPENQGPVLVDYPFVFNGLETHQLVTFKLFEYLEVTENMKFDAASLAERAHSLGISYIVLPTRPEYVENANYTPLFEGLRDIPYYEKFLEPEGYLILKKKQNF